MPAEVSKLAFKGGVSSSACARKAAGCMSSTAVSRLSLTNSLIVASLVKNLGENGADLEIRLETVSLLKDPADNSFSVPLLAITLVSRKQRGAAARIGYSC